MDQYDEVEDLSEFDSNHPDYGFSGKYSEIRLKF